MYLVSGAVLRYRLAEYGGGGSGGAAPVDSGCRAIHHRTPNVSPTATRTHTVTSATSRRTVGARSDMDSSGPILRRRLVARKVWKPGRPRDGIGTVGGGAHPYFPAGGAKNEPPSSLRGTDNRLRGRSRSSRAIRLSHRRVSSSVS